MQSTPDALRRRAFLSHAARAGYCNVMVFAMSELERRLQKARRSYTAALMNDTKWREVLSVLAEFEIPVQVAGIGEHDFTHAVPVPKNGLSETHTKDWGGGPINYRDILALRWARFEDKRDPTTGKEIKDESRGIALLHRLATLGQLPIQVNDDYVVLHGYRDQS